MTPITICVPWMTGRRSVRIVSARVRDLTGVERVHADPDRGRLVVYGTVTAEQVRTAVAEARCQAIGDGGTALEGDQPDRPPGTTGRRS